MNNWIREVFAGRPWWMNALMVFSGYMAFVYLSPTRTVPS